MTIFTTELVYVTVGNPSFYLALYLTAVDFQGKLHHVGHVGEQKIKCWPIRTREIACVRLWEELYVYHVSISQKNVMKISYRKKTMCIHCLRYRNFTQFSDVEICRNEQFQQSLEQIVRNFAKTVRFRKIYTPEN